MSFKVLGIHGIGKHSQSDQVWRKEWNQAIDAAFDNVSHKVEFCYLDEIFLEYPLTLTQTWNALTMLGGNWMSSDSDKAADRSWFRDNTVAWTAGMVMQWAGNPELCRKLRDKLRATITEFQPDLIIAHSLGSLVAYDLLGSSPEIAPNCILLTLGSQIKSQFVAGIFEHGVHPLGGSAIWCNLFNKHDLVFVSEITFQGATNFASIETHFVDSKGFLSAHTDISGYLNHHNTKWFWTFIHQTAAARYSATGARRSLEPKPFAFERLIQMRAPPKPTNPPTRRALLIGINKFAHPGIPPLAGCVNDCFLVSAALQEHDFQPSDVRLVPDDRATRQGILEALAWLFQNPRPSAGDVRFLYFSGHGVRLNAKDHTGLPNRTVEAFVPYDYADTLGSAITDADLSPFYEGLEHQGSDFSLIPKIIFAFDCCYSGGLVERTLEAGVRTIAPPDHQRHAQLQWSKAEQMWIPRQYPPAIEVRSVTGASGANASKDPFRSSKKRSVTDFDDKEREQAGEEMKKAIRIAGNSLASFRFGMCLPQRMQSRSSIEQAPQAASKESGELEKSSESGELSAFESSASFASSSSSVSSSSPTGWIGPFMPLVITACGEAQVAKEYHHGAISYGAFSFAFCNVLSSLKSNRSAAHSEIKIPALTFQVLVRETAEKLKRMGYAQVPSVSGPTKLLSIDIEGKLFETITAK